MIKVLWTPIARDLLEETVEFITELWNDEVVEAFFNQLDCRIEQIQQSPRADSIFW